MNKVRKGEQEVDLRPITPSKIPVGAWRAEEERAITRALNGSMDSNRQSGGERSVSPAPPSRIPKFSISKLGPKYRAVQVTKRLVTPAPPSTLSPSWVLSTQLSR